MRETTVRVCLSAACVCRFASHVLVSTSRLCIIAGNISPIDVITHIPILCEEAGVPYIFVPSKEDLGAAGNTKRATSVVLIPAPKDASQEHHEYFPEVLEEVNKVQLSF